ncbi:22851_t:CDS:2, partial [Gigaspora margarita]
IGASEGSRKYSVRINLNNCKYIVTGDHHSMAVNNENKVYTWGFVRKDLLKIIEERNKEIKEKHEMIEKLNIEK